MILSNPPIPTEEYHRFLDEAGDTTFYGKGMIPMMGQPGVSLCFILGMVKFRTPLEKLRTEICSLQRDIENAEYFKQVPSIQKKNRFGRFLLPCKRWYTGSAVEFFEFIKGIDCSFEAIMARKIPALYQRKHNNNESEFYADMLSHLLKNKMMLGSKLVLNIAERGKTTKNQNLQIALTKATSRYQQRRPDSPVKTEFVFNVQNQKTEPLLNIADYFCWSIQRVFEKGEIRYYNFIQEKIRIIVDLYDAGKYEGNRNYYTKNNILTTENKLSPPLY